METLQQNCGETEHFTAFRNLPVTGPMKHDATTMQNSTTRALRSSWARARRCMFASGYRRDVFMDTVVPTKRRGFNMHFVAVPHSFRRISFRPKFTAAVCCFSMASQSTALPCNVCKVSKHKHEFSKNQLRQKGARTCKLCVSQAQSANGQVHTWTSCPLPLPPDVQPAP